MSYIWISIILLVSELLPFISQKYNGIVHYIYEKAKNNIILDKKIVEEKQERNPVPLGGTVKI